MKKLLNYLEIVNPGKKSISEAYDSNFTMLKMAFNILQH